MAGCPGDRGGGVVDDDFLEKRDLRFAPVDVQRICSLEVDERGAPPFTV
jgi:hypothetical protein